METKKAPESMIKAECVEGFSVKKAGPAIYLEGFANKATVDRVNEVIEPDGWELDNFKKNPVILFNHGMDFDFGGLPVGKATEIMPKEGGLWIKVKLSNSKSDRITAVRDLVSEGILRAFSVGFDPKEIEPSTGEGIPTKIKRAELFETSIVGVPMNQDSVGTVSEKALKAINVLNKYRIKEECEEEEENKDEKQAGSGTTPESEGHSHGFSVDEEGNGKTTSTSDGEGHSHDISDYSVQEANGHSHGKVELEKEGDKEEETTDEENQETEEKTFQECVSEKIPQLIDEGMDQDQAVAVAISMCSEDGKSQTPSRDDYKQFFEIADNYVTSKQADQEEVSEVSTQVQTEKNEDDFGNPHLETAKQTNVLLGSLIAEIQGLRADVIQLNKSQPAEEVEEKTGDELKENEETTDEEDQENKSIDSDNKSNDNKAELDKYKERLDYCKQRLQKLGF